MPPQPGPKVPERGRCLLPAGRLGQSKGQHKPRKSGGKIRQIGQPPAQGQRRPGAEGAAHGRRPVKNAHPPGHPFIVPGAVCLQQAVVGDGLSCAAEQIVGKRRKPHGQADAPDAPAGDHGEAGQRPHSHAGGQRAPAAQKVRRHTAGHLAQKAYQMKKALGQADLGQRKAPPGQQHHPDHLGKSEAAHRFEKIQCAELMFDLHNKKSFPNQVACSRPVSERMHCTKFFPGNSRKRDLFRHGGSVLTEKRAHFEPEPPFRCLFVHEPCAFSIPWLRSPFLCFCPHHTMAAPPYASCFSF